MNIKSGLFYSLMLIFFSVIFCQAQLPDTPEATVVKEYLRIFNAGDEQALRDFFLTNISEKGLKERPIESRVERFRTLRKDLKSFEVQKLLGISENEVNILVKSGTGELLTLGFVFEQKQKLSAIRILMGEAPMQLSDPPLTKKDLINEIERFLAQQVDNGKFSGTVLVTRKDETLFSGAYGFADKRFKIPNSLETKFNLGSINKFFTRMAIGQLAEAGRVSFDDLLIRDLPKYPNKSVAEKITIRQLLEMTSGLGDFFNQQYESTPKGNIRNLDDYTKLFLNDSLLFEPGTDHRYSNAGYIVLGLVIEHVSGEDYYSYVRRHIFDPAGMTHTDWYPMDGITPDLATGYTHPDGDTGRWVSNIYSAPGRGSSAGGGYSTVGDLYKFVQALRNGKLLSPKYCVWMIEGEVPAQNPKIPLTQGDFGIAGGAPGINAALEFDASTDDIIIVLANYDPPAATDVAKTIRGLLKRLQ